MKTKTMLAALAAIPLAAFAALPKEISVAAGESRPCGVDVRNLYRSLAKDGGWFP